MFSGVYIQSPSLSLRNLLSQTQRRSRLNFLSGSVFSKKNVFRCTTENQASRNRPWTHSGQTVLQFPTTWFLFSTFEGKIPFPDPKTITTNLGGTLPYPTEMWRVGHARMKFATHQLGKTPHELSSKTPLSPRMVYQDLVQDAKNLGLLFFPQGVKEGLDACQNPHSEIWCNEGAKDLLCARWLRIC